MYVGGAFKYPYLEDTDPWAHALSAKYIAVEKTAYAPGQGYQYLDPYPPGYDLVMAILNQTSGSMLWTLKFFNGLILSLGIIFFYFFANSFMGDRKKALFATFVLAAIPSFFTHFIWAHSLVVALFFPTLYCLEKIQTDKRWTLSAMLLVASIPLVQPSQALKLGIMLGIYFVVKSLYERKFLKEHLFALVGGLLISLVWWLTKGLEMLSSVRQDSIIRHGATVSTSFFAKIVALFPAERGTATKAYVFSDFFTVKPFGGINQHLGWGAFVTILVVIGMIYLIFNYKKIFKSQNSWIGITLLWFIFTFLGTNSVTFNLPVGLFAFRFWILLAIPAALLSSLGLVFLFEKGKKIGLPAILILLVILVGVIATSGYQKYQHNTSPNWPPDGRWTSMEELQGFIWLKTLPDNTNIFVISTDEEKAIVGFDKYICAWCKETQEFRKDFINTDAVKLHSWLKKNNYEYIIISGMSYRYLTNEFGENRTREFLPKLNDEIASSGLYQPTHQTKGMLVFKVV